MIIASIDIETTGLDPSTCQILEFGCVLFRVGDDRPVDQMPSFQRLIYHQTIRGEPYAIRMNRDLVLDLADINAENLPNGYCLIKDLGKQFKEWLIERNFATNNKGSVTIWAAGKNFAGFDNQFLKAIGWTWDDQINIKHRAFDPAILFFDPAKDEEVPALEKCLQRAGFSTGVTHQALGDAKAVIECLRFAWSSNVLPAGVR